MIRFGRFFFRYRNIVGPFLLLSALVMSAPRTRLAGDVLHEILEILGFIAALSGQSLRILTIGYEYIVRGGRNRQVYANDLVQGGVFAHCRNPLYAGNILIVVGFALVIDAIPFFLVVVPTVVFVYMCIVAAEEEYLQDKFGAAYEDYMRRVNRWWPNFTGFRRSVADMRFNWKRVLAKEYNTTFLLLAALVGLHYWRNYRIAGLSTLPSTGEFAAGLTLWLAAYLCIYGMKKAGQLAG